MVLPLAATKHQGILQDDVQLHTVSSAYSKPAIINLPKVWEVRELSQGFITLSIHTDSILQQETYTISELKPLPEKKGAQITFYSKKMEPTVQNFTVKDEPSCLEILFYWGDYKLDI